MPYIIGIAEGSASGKSTFADMLTKKLFGMDIIVFHMDDYFKANVNLPHSVSPVSGKEYADYNHPDLFCPERLRIDIASVKADIA